VWEGGSHGELSQKPGAAAVIGRGGGGSPGLVLRSPKAGERRNMRKRVEMLTMSLARDPLKSTKRSRRSG